MKVMTTTMMITMIVRRLASMEYVMANNNVQRRYNGEWEHNFVTIPCASGQPYGIDYVT